MEQIRLFLFHNTPSPGISPFEDAVINAVDDPTVNNAEAFSNYINNVPTDASNFMVTDAPTLIFTFIENSVNIPVARLTGNEIQTQKIIEVIKNLNGFQSTGNGQFENNGVIIGNGEELSLGFLGLGLFNIDLPAWMWGVKTALCAYQTAKNSNNATKYLWGAGTAVSAANLANKINKS